MRAVVLHRGEDGYWVAECSSLPACIRRGKSKAEAIGNIREAIDGWMETAKADGDPELSIGKRTTVYGRQQMPVSTFRAAMHSCAAFLLAGCALEPSAALRAPTAESPLDPGIYSGEMTTVFRTIGPPGTTEETITEVVTIPISESGIPMVDGEEIRTGRTITANLGTFTQTITYRSVLATDQGVVITSDVINSNGTGGVATATFRPAGSNAISYSLEQDIRAANERLAAHSTGVLVK